MNILHITTHLGGGVGKAISGIVIQAAKCGINSHRVCMLQFPEKSKYINECKKNDVLVDILPNCIEWFSWADVIVISWWNHPQMSHFLINLPKIDKPYILWSHINGIFYPVLPFWFAQAFDRVLFTSYLTMNNPIWTPKQREQIAMKADVVYGMGQFEPDILPRKSDYTQKEFFTVGYVGTLNYGKIHPQIVYYCLEAVKKIPNIRFIFVGDCDNNLKSDIYNAGLMSYVTFTGFVSDVFNVMKSFDVFGYLLQPNHYGTTENSLLEAMACGLPVIVRSQNVEKYIVPKQCGYLIETPEEYAQVLYELYNNPKLRENMGKKAQKYVIEHYNSEKNLEIFHNSCNKALGNTNIKKNFCNFGKTPWEWFLAFLTDEDRMYFEMISKLLSSKNLEEQKKAMKMLEKCPLIFKEERKSSLRHFSTVYPDDIKLKKIASFL